MVAFRALLVASLVALSLAHSEKRHLKIIGRDGHAVVENPQHAGISPELQLLADGNKAFREAEGNQELLKSLTFDGQFPPFMYLGCVDSRVNEGTIFNAKSGTFFTQRNIGNQFHPTDASVESTLAFGVSVLRVKHVIVMGHYGCGGVGNAIASRPNGGVDAGFGAIMNWIDPIRDLFQSSKRSEIVQLREKIGNSTVGVPDVREPGYRALVEENVKVTVERIAKDYIITNHYALLAQAKEETLDGPRDVFIHGWVYDIENGEVRDLGVSVGPAGKPIPKIPFANVVDAAHKTAEAHGSHGSTEKKVEVTLSHGQIVDKGNHAAITQDPAVLCADQCKSKKAVI
ncbi:carbonic anhydrase [Coprinopsis sp. MPI-PUGE-AT-0042]|nr:carbonic anhydrase [Coprinopsis sp. MPI-PUGE-AT-0042]